MKNKRVALILLTLLVAIFMMTFAAACEVTGDPDALGIADMNFGDRLVTGLLVFVPGLAMVFIVLFVLIGCIKLVELLIALPEKLAKKNAVEAVKEEKREEEQRFAEETEALRAAQEEEEIVVAITAAITAYYCGAAAPVEMSELPFRVRSIKEIK